MNVKQAVANAKRYIVDLYEEETPRNVGLEEVELDAEANEWVVTIGFSRPWDEPRNTFAALVASVPHRAYKVVRISNGSEEVLSVKNREALG